MAPTDRVHKIKGGGRMKKKKVRFALPDDALVKQVLEQGSPTPLRTRAAVVKKSGSRAAPLSTKAAAEEQNDSTPPTRAAMVQEQAQRVAPSSININIVPASANNEHLLKPHRPDPVYYTTNRSPTDRFLRVFVPDNPDDHPFWRREPQHVRTVHHKSRAYIIQLVEDELERIEAVYARSHGQDADADVSSFIGFMERDVRVALKGRGVQLKEFCRRPKRVVVGFEDEEVKLKGGLVMLGMQPDVAKGMLAPGGWMWT